MRFNVGTGQLDPIDADICVNDMVSRPRRLCRDRRIRNLEHRTDTASQMRRIKIERRFALAIVINMK